MVKTNIGSGDSITGEDFPAYAHDGPGPRIMSADTLEGDDVVNSQGDNLGTIETIMLDMVNGRIAYAVLSFGGFMGAGDKLFAIP